MVKTYMQKMQSLYGSRKFVLETRPQEDHKVMISLYENKNGKYICLGNRSAEKTEESIKRAIKSLQRKAKCKLYYILLIDTDGNYL